MIKQNTDLLKFIPEYHDDVVKAYHMIEMVSSHDNDDLAMIVYHDNLFGMWFLSSRNVSLYIVEVVDGCKAKFGEWINDVQ